MWCWWPSHIKPHQVSYESVAALSIETFHSADDISFPTIRPEYNGALAAFNRHNARLACDYDVRCSAGGHPKSSLIRRAIYEAVEPLSMERFHSAEEMSFPNIRTEYNGAPAAFNRHNARLACDYDVRCSAGGHPKSSLIRSAIRDCSTAVNGKIP